MSAMQIREMFGRGDDLRDAGLSFPEDVEVAADIPYGSDPHQLLDVYLPGERDDGALPVIVSVHGGAWVYGDKERYRHYAMSLARHGFAVVNFTYRLCPESPFPAQVHDTAAVLRWLENSGGEYGLDMQNIFAVGDSCGGHILGIYCNASADEVYAGQLGFDRLPGVLPRAVGLNSSCYFFNGEAAPDEPSIMLIRDIMPGGGTPQELDLGNVVLHATSDFPPAFITTAPLDFLRYQVPLFTAKLEELGVPFSYNFYSGDDGNLGHVFNCDIRSPWADRCNREQLAWFSSLIRF